MPPSGVPTYLGYYPNSNPVYATDGIMTYLELYAPPIGFYVCNFAGYGFLAYPPIALNIAYLEIILPAQKTVRTILHSSRE
jgi:hypothetical protein